MLNNCSVPENNVLKCSGICRAVPWNNDNRQNRSGQTNFGRFFCQNQSGRTNFRGTGFGVTSGMIFLEEPATPKRLYNIYNLERKIVR